MSRSCEDCIYAWVCRYISDGGRDFSVAETCDDFTKHISVAYLCKEHGEGNTCPRDGSTCSYDVCKHATDVKYAKNFVQVDDDKYAEIDDDQKRWIPCSERLPEEHGYYLVTTDGNRNSVIDIAEYSDWETGKPSWFKASKILAWMPLPEPYKGGENDEK